MADPEKEPWHQSWAPAAAQLSRPWSDTTVGHSPSHPKSIQLWHSFDTALTQLWHSFDTAVPCHTMSYHFTWDPYWGCRRFLDIFKWSTMALRHHQSHSVTIIVWYCLILIALLSTIINYHQLSSTIINYHQLLLTIINYIINYHQLSSTIINYIINYINIYTGAMRRFLICVSTRAQCGTVWHLRSAAQLQVGVGILYQSLAQTNYDQLTALLWPCEGSSNAMQTCHTVTTRYNTSQYSTQNTTGYDRSSEYSEYSGTYLAPFGSSFVVVFCGILWLVCLTWAVAASPNSRVPRSFIRSSLHGWPRKNWRELDGNCTGSEKWIGWNWMENDWKSMNIYEARWRFVKICADCCEAVCHCESLSYDCRRYVWQRWHHATAGRQTSPCCSEKKQVQVAQGDTGTSTTGVTATGRTRGTCIVWGTCPAGPAGAICRIGICGTCCTGCTTGCADCIDPGRIGRISRGGGGTGRPRGTVAGMAGVGGWGWTGTSALRHEQTRKRHLSTEAI